MELVLHWKEWIFLYRPLPLYLNHIYVSLTIQLSELNSWTLKYAKSIVCMRLCGFIHPLYISIADNGWKRLYLNRCKLYKALIMFRFISFEFYSRALERIDLSRKTSMNIFSNHVFIWHPPSLNLSPLSYTLSLLSLSLSSHSPSDYIFFSEILSILLYERETTPPE